MSENSSIEWTDATWNPIAGCSIVSPGCHNCYAMRMASRLEAMGQEKYAGTTKDGRWTGKINLDEEALSIPLRKKKPTTWFVNSTSDLFHEDVPLDFIVAVFAVMHACPQHTFQILTKRAERACNTLRWLQDQGGIGNYVRSEAGRKMIRHRFDRIAKTEIDNGRKYRAPDDPWMDVFNAAAITTGGPDSNVWIGTSCEDQKRADERIPHLLKTPAAVRFLSCEPLLGPIYLGSFVGFDCPACNRRESECECDGPDGEFDLPPAIHWVIVGGESGPGSRPMHPDWVRGIRDQCQAAGVAFFFKQWGEWAPSSATPNGVHYSVKGKRIDLQGRDLTGLHGLHGESDAALNRVGKKAAGRLLDGREWNELPEASHA